MSVDFHTVYPDPDPQTPGITQEPWEMECRRCGERIDIDHYADMQVHDDLHAWNDWAAALPTVRFDMLHHGDVIVIRSPYGGDETRRVDTTPVPTKMPIAPHTAQDWEDEPDPWTDAPESTHDYLRSEIETLKAFGFEVRIQARRIP